MNLIPTLTDSRGRESVTLTFVAVAALALIVKFVLAGLTLGPIGQIPAMGAGEFGVAFAAVLAIWLGREWTDKRASKPSVDA